MTPMPRQTVSETLACLDDDFKAVGAAFARGEYILWLGSGLSRFVVPDVSTLLTRLLEFLQNNLDDEDAQCRYRRAIDRILNVGGVSGPLRSAIDISSPVHTWPGLTDVVSRLVDKYSDVLDVHVNGVVEEDYLVWTGLNVAVTYGSPDLVPDEGHLCVAMLMMEGVVHSAPTTNWDGLVESAVDRLNGGLDHVLNVAVRPEDFASSRCRSELVKFHGCAVRAAADPAEYRKRLIARKTQISGWDLKPENRMMKSHLEHLLSSRPALVIGLSAQDANIHTMLHQASQNLVRPWPATPPAVVLAEEQLSPHHEHMLKVTYGENCYALNSDAIDSSALLGAYAKPALAGLVLYTLCDKLCSLLDALGDLSLAISDIASLREEIRLLRDAASDWANEDVRSLVEGVIAAVRLIMSTFRSGTLVDADRYVPLTTEPIAVALGNPDFAGNALGRLAVAAALLGRGRSRNEWNLRPGTEGGPDHCSLRVVSSTGRTSRVVIVRDPTALTSLEGNSLVDLSDPGLVVLHASDAPPRSTRSPRKRLPRTGAQGAREVDLAKMGRSSMTADDLFESFKLEAAL